MVDLSAVVGGNGDEGGVVIADVATRQIRGGREGETGDEDCMSPFHPMDFLEEENR